MEENNKIDKKNKKKESNIGIIVFVICVICAILFRMGNMSSTSSQSQTHLIHSNSGGKIDYYKHGKNISDYFDGKISFYELSPNEQKIAEDLEVFGNSWGDLGINELSPRAQMRVSEWCSSILMTNPELVKKLTQQIYPKRLKN